MSWHAAGAQSNWTVRPQWVRAHEEFLASDALAGRGSATRDEEIAATYVASQFLGYGLQPAPQMTSFLQVATVIAPQLDGHGVLSCGTMQLREGADLHLLVSSGVSVSGRLVLAPLATPIAGDLHGAVVVATGQGDEKAVGNFARAARRAGASAVVIEQGAGADHLAAQWGGGTRTFMRLEEKPPTSDLNLVAISSAGIQALQQMPAGQLISLTVQSVPRPAPRKTYNAIGYLPGKDPAAGTILLTAHLDHLGVGKPVNGDAIYNGANDDAAGTTAVLELAHALASGPPLRRGVLFVCYGSEEAGELGSEYFGRHSPVPIKDLVANLEFEMIGTQDPKMPKDTLLLTGWDRSNLGPALKEHGARLGPDPYPEQHFFERSDNYQLALQGVVAHTAAGYGTPSTYHQPDDDLAHLNLEFMTTAIQSLIEPVRWLAESDFKPVWNKDGQPHR